MQPSWPPGPPAPLTAFPPPPVRRGFGLGVVLSASVLSAVIATVATLAVLAPERGPTDGRPAGGVLTSLESSTPAPALSASPSGAASPAPSGQASRGGRPIASTGPSPVASAGGSASAPVGSSASAPAVSPDASAAASPAVSPVAAALAGDPNAVIVAVAARVSPAVVTITSDIAGNSYDPFSMPGSGIGSGFVFDSGGWILTNDHVVEGASSLTVAFKGGRQLPARVIAADPAADLAVIRVDATSLPTVTIGTSRGLAVGQLLIAIGSPLGTYSDSVTSGILSATGRSLTVADYATRQRRNMKDLLQTDAAINPGNSGGPLLNAAGEVIGINTAVDQSAEGIGFAIPIDAARAIMEQARKSG